MQRPIPMSLFALAAFTPLMLFGGGVVFGGGWALVGLVYMTVFAALMDQMLPYFTGDAPEGAEFPAADAVLVLLGLGHLALFPCVVWAVAGDSGLNGWGRGIVFLGAGLWFGQVANPCAHELIHRGGRKLFGLGVVIYASMLFGHHASAHRLVHHQHAASADDPNTARSGEGYYRFFIRAWTGSFSKGFAAETALRQRAKKKTLHPYAVYFCLSAISLLCGYLIAGWVGVAVWTGLALHSTSQLMLSDYVQHYGLLRKRRADGRLEPVSAAHSWNAPHWFSAAMMLNAPRHSDHHAHPSRPYPALRLPQACDAPMLPWPLPFACLIALAPPLWKRLMRPHLAPWRHAQ
jgi:alkane 1-monooxygenase